MVDRGAGFARIGYRGPRPPTLETARPAPAGVPAIIASFPTGPVAARRRRLPIRGFPMTAVLLIIHLFVTLALIGVVLIQRSEGGGLGVGTSQGMGSFMSGRGTANLLTRTTAVLAALFFGLSLTLALLNKGTSIQRSILDVPSPANSTAPAGPAAPSGIVPGGSSAPGGSVPLPAPAAPAPAAPVPAVPAPAAPAPATPAPGGPSVPTH